MSHDKSACEGPYGCTCNENCCNDHLGLCACPYENRDLCNLTHGDAPVEGPAATEAPEDEPTTAWVRGEKVGVILPANGSYLVIDGSVREVRDARQVGRRRWEVDLEG